MSRSRSPDGDVRMDDEPSRAVSRSPPRSPKKDGFDRDAPRYVVVSNLTRNVEDYHLKAIFRYYGEIVGVDLPKYANTGQNRGRASIEFATPSEAEAARKHMEKGQIDGNVVTVELDTRPLPRDSPVVPPPRYGGPKYGDRERGGDRDRGGRYGGGGRRYDGSRSRSPPPRRNGYRDRERSPSPDRSPVRRRGSPDRRVPRDVGSERDRERDRGFGSRGYDRAPARRVSPPPRYGRPRDRSDSRDRDRDRNGYRRSSPPRRRRSYTPSRSRTRSPARSDRSYTRSPTRSRSPSRTPDSRDRSYTRSPSYDSRDRSRSRSRARDDSRGRSYTRTPSPRGKERSRTPSSQGAEKR